METDAVTAGSGCPPGRTGRVGALALALLVLAVCAASLAVTPSTFGVGGDLYSLPQFYLPDLLLGLTWGLGGAYIAGRSRHLAGWAIAMVGLGFAVSAGAIQWNLLAVDGRVGGEALSACLVVSGWTVGALIAFLVLPWLIVARPMTRTAWVGAAAGLAVALAAGALRFLGGIPDGPAALVPESVSAAAARLDGRLVPIYGVLAIPGGLHLVRGMSRSDPRERRALGWVLGSVLVLASSYLLFEAGLTAGGTVLTAAAATMFVAQVMLFAATFTLALRSESWSVSLVVSRSIVAALLGGAVVAIAALLIWLATRTLPLDADAAGLVAVVLVAFGVGPLRAWVQRHVDELVFGSGARATRLLENLGRELGPGAGDDLLGNLAEGLRRSLRLRRVEITAMPAGPRAIAGTGHEVQRTVALCRGGIDVGTVRLTAPPGQRLDPRTVRVVEQLSGMVAISVELATANQALEMARRRLLDARQEERRLIRRELHDGLGPSLSGVTLALAAIANTSSLRPADAVLLRDVCAELDRRAGDVRQMARVLLPPALEVGRLEEALGDLAVRFTDDTFSVTVAVDGADDLPERHQVAAYHIAAEGVRNAHRHAGARQCAVRLGAGPDGSVLLEVEDDGAGLDPRSEPGVGLSSMRERAAELGGTFDLTSGADGARVRVRLP